MTFKHAQQEIRKLGMTLGKRYGEYRVAFPNDEASAYYTNDLEDAIGTARDMAARKDSQ